MKPVEFVRSKFKGNTIGSPLTEADLQKFEAKWQRKIPRALREFLEACNGFAFEADLVHGEDSVYNVHALWEGMDRALTTYEEFLEPNVIPFSVTSSGDQFCLRCADEDGPVYLTNSVGGDEPENAVMEWKSAHFFSFLTELTEAP